MTPNSSLDVLAVIRSPLEHYPPSLNQVRLMSRAGLKVGVVDLWHPEVPRYPFQNSDAVTRWPSCRHVHGYHEPYPSLFVRVYRTWKFKRDVQRAIVKARVRVIIAYDPYAMWAVGNIWEKASRPKLIWHYHELFPVQPGSKSFAAKAVNYSYAYADRADLLVFPDACRAVLFNKDANSKTPLHTVMNCPPLVSEIPGETLSRVVKERGIPSNKIVYFQGSIGPGRRLEEIFRSMKWWPEDAILAMIGPVSEGYKSLLLKEAAAINRDKRVVFVGAVPYKDIWGLSAGASVGLSLVDGTNNPNWEYSAGAINKRFEYMSVGIPQVANQGPGLDEVIEQTGVGLLVPPSSPEDIGRGVTKILSNPELQKEMGQKARAMHLKVFNYETQFQRTLDQIQQWVNK